jgi:ribonuclease D
MLQLLLKVKADVNGIASHMIANKDDLEAIALGKTDTPAMQGWRYEIFGQKAEALLQGRLKLSLNPKNKQVVFEEILE